ncbi:hypothetical protein ABPG75_009583 [Micractinium tetrahymenae]
MLGKRRSSGGGMRSGSGGSETQEQQQQQQQREPAEPLYRRLDDAIAAGPAAEALQLPQPEANTQVVTALLEQLMATNPRALDTRAAIGLKVADRSVLLDNPVGRKAAGQAGKAGAASRRTAQLASKSAQRRLGLYQLRSAGLTYEAVQPLHASWQQYMRDLLASGGGPGAADLEARLYAADLHGCLIRVAHTADKRYQGLRGIVVRDTANTLRLVTPDNRFVVVPKQLCTWEFDADRRRVATLLGPGLAQRGTGTAGGGAKPKTLREAIRGQQRG